MKNTIAHGKSNRNQKLHFSTQDFLSRAVLQGGGQNMPKHAHVKQALSELADAIEAVQHTVAALADEVGQLPASAEAAEIRRAAHSCQVGALWLSWQALSIAKVGGVLQVSAEEAEAHGRQ